MGRRNTSDWQKLRHTNKEDTLRWTHGWTDSTDLEDGRWDKRRGDISSLVPDVLIESSFWPTSSTRMLLGSEHFLGYPSCCEQLESVDWLLQKQADAWKRKHAASGLRWASVWFVDVGSNIRHYNPSVSQARGTRVILGWSVDWTSTH